MASAAGELVEVGVLLRRAVESEDFTGADTLLRSYAGALRTQAPDREAWHRARGLFFWMHQMTTISRAGYAAKLSALRGASTYLSNGAKEAARQTIRVEL